MPEQPIFYLVLNIEYARKIASKWNTKDEQSGYKGYVLRFEVDDKFIFKYEVQTVGARKHQEYWIPAEELAAFNSNIIGNIIVLEEYQ